MIKAPHLILRKISAMFFEARQAMDLSSKVVDLLYCVMLCYAVLCCALLYYDMIRYDMICFVMLSYVIFSLILYYCSLPWPAEVTS